LKRVYDLTEAIISVKDIAAVVTLSLPRCVRGSKDGLRPRTSIGSSMNRGFNGVTGSKIDGLSGLRAALSFQPSCFGTESKQMGYTAIYFLASPSSSGSNGTAAVDAHALTSRDGKITL